MERAQQRDSWADAFSDFVTIYLAFCAHPVRMITDPPRDVLVPTIEVDHGARFIAAVKRSQHDRQLRDEFEQFTQLSTQQQRAAVRAASRSSDYADRISGA